MQAGRVPDIVRVRGGAIPYDDEAQRRSAGSSTVRGIETTQLARTFFSSDNVDALQQGIRYGVFRASEGRHVISRQSDRELEIVMRSVFLQHARNEPGNVLQQVRDLNARVLEFCVPRIVAEISMYLTHQRDLAMLPTPMDRGEMASSKGTKVLDTARF